ncbi:MAG: hypothetical protein KIT56_07925 [Gammaproteobacteria bacterium]|nr:hypothetical protein [Gammaproteobacteria bacterium]MCW5583788.1 hypothetical protein [Gammaproteobacteria bacterium]
MKPRRRKSDEDKIEEALKKITNFFKGKTLTLNVDEIFGNLLAPWNIETIHHYHGDRKINEDVINTFLEAAQSYFTDENITLKNIGNKYKFIEKIYEKEDIDMGNTIEERSKFLRAKGLILATNKAMKSKESLVNNLTDYKNLREKQNDSLFGYSKIEKIIVVGVFIGFLEGDKNRELDVIRNISVLTKGRLGDVIKIWFKKNKEYAKSIFPKELNDRLESLINKEKKEEILSQNILRTGRYGR